MLNSPMLDEVAGKKTSDNYIFAAVILYVLAFIILTYLTIDSLESVLNSLEATGRSFEDDSVDSQPVFLSNALLSCLIAAGIPCAVIYFRYSDMDASGILILGYHILVWGLLGGFLAVLISAIIGAIPYIYVGMILAVAGLGENDLLIYAGIYLELVGIIGFGFIPGLAVQDMSWAFPEEQVDQARDLSQAFEQAEESLERGELALANHNVEDATGALVEVNDALGNGDRLEDPLESFEERAEEMNSRIKDYYDRLWDLTLSKADELEDSGENIRAHILISNAIDVTDRTDLVSSPPKKLRDYQESIEPAAADEFNRMATTVSEGLEQTKAKREASAFGEAREELWKAESVYEDLTNLHENSNIEPSIDSQEIRSRIETEHREVEREETATLLDIDRSTVDLDAENIEIYENLTDLAREIDKFRSEYSTYPWDEFQDGLVRELPSLTTERIDEYLGILEDIRTVFSFLDSVSTSHPSVDADGWTKAINTALKEQYREVLQPAITQIDRLEQGPLWTQEELARLTWEEFEKLVGDLYEGKGYSVTVTQGTADLGVDVWVEKDDTRTAIQVKHFQSGNTVGREPLQKLVSMIASGDADRAIVVTSSNFARTARQYSQDFGSNLELINGDNLVRMLSESENETKDPASLQRI